MPETIGNPDSRRLCMGCMNPLPEGRNECGICGYVANANNPAQYLPVRTVLSERYLVGKLLESAGDAATYLGYDQVLKAAIVIREFFPDTLCERLPSGELRIINGCENTFRDYYTKFRNHARALARMRELTSIVSVYDIFEQNRTAYTVSEFCEGISLETRLKQLGGHMRWETARPLFMPLMATLHSLHTAGIYHLGISPEALIIGTDGKLHLQGFSIEEARKVSTDLRPKLISGYTSPEQYAFGQDTGAWSDVYALAATMFRTLTGNPPPDGPKRAKDGNDLYVPTEVAAELPDYVAAALFHALQANPEKRIRTIEQFRDQLSTAPAVSALRKDDHAAAKDEDAADDDVEEPAKPKNNRTKYALLIVLAVFVFLLLLAGTVLLIIFPDTFGSRNVNSGTSESGLSTMVAKPTATQPVVSADMYAVTNVVGQNFYTYNQSSLTGRMKLELASLQYSDKEKGTILSQTPSEGNTAAEGSTIKIIISAGPESHTVPDVTGWDHTHAKLYLEALGFKVVETPVFSDTVDLNIVESVSNVGESQKIGSTITVRYSNTALTTAPPPTTTTTQPATTITKRHSIFG